MIQTLCEHAQADDARLWLIDQVHRIGPGYHLDTPYADYIIDPDTPIPTFSKSEARALDESKERAFQLLGDVEPYDICLDEIRWMLAEVFGVR